MPYTKEQLITTVSIVYLILLTALASWAASRANNLSLPIEHTLSGFTAALPIIAGLLLESGHTLAARHSKRNKPANPSSTLPAPPPYIIIANTFILIYSTVIITLLGTHTSPSGSRICGLETRWHALFKAKNGEAIRTIQDAFKCCGFMTSRDKAWPFPDKTHGADACEKRFERTTACVGAWKREEQRMAGVLMGVVGLVVVWELLIVLTASTPSSWLSQIMPHRLRRGTDEERNNNHHDPRHALDYQPIHGRYSDNPITEEESEIDDGDAVQQTIEGQKRKGLPGVGDVEGRNELGGTVEQEQEGNEWAGH